MLSMSYITFKIACGVGEEDEDGVAPLETEMLYSGNLTSFPLLIHTQWDALKVRIWQEFLCDFSSPAPSPALWHAICLPVNGSYGNLFK